MKTNNSVLIKIFLKLDFGNRNDSGKGRILSVIATYLITNSLLMISFYLNSSKDRFILLSLSLNFFLISFILISEFTGLFFSKRTWEVISYLPLREDEIFLSKTVSGIVYLSVFPLTLSLPQSVFFYFYEKNITETAYYFIVSLMFSGFVLGLVFLLNTLFLSYIKGKSKTLLIVFQVFFVFFVLYVNRFLSNTPADYLPDRFSLMGYLPQYFLLLSFGNKVYFLFAFAVTALIYVFAYMFFRNKYSLISGFVNASDTVIKKKISAAGLLKLAGKFEKTAIGNKTEKASFYLVKNMLKNSTVLKMRILILFFMPLIVLCVGLILDIPEMLFLQWGKNELLIVSPSLSVIILMSLMLILSGLRTSIDNDTDINWIYDSVPMDSKVQFKRGCLKFVLLYYLFPVLVISGSLLSVKISVSEVLINIFYLLSFLLVFTEVLLRIGTALPFSTENLRLDSVTKYTDIFVVLITGTVFFVSQIIIFKNVIFTISAVILFLIIYLFLAGINIRKKSI